MRSNVLSVDAATSQVRFYVLAQPNVGWRARRERHRCTRQPRGAFSLTVEREDEMQIAVCATSHEAAIALFLWPDVVRERHACAATEGKEEGRVRKLGRYAERSVML
jgi:hypothetical protein